jgi:hypothetical protein
MERLEKIAQTLHVIDTNSCNLPELSKAQQTREKNLETEALIIAKEMGFYLYRQGDPRGCPIYLLETVNDRNNYHQKGIAICNKRR